MPVLLDHDVSPSDGLEERLARLREDIRQWIEPHVEAIRALGPVETTRCTVGGRHFAGYECFDCDFVGGTGDVHLVTVTACFVNQLADLDAQVVDAVSALTLIGMLLERVGMKASLSPS